MAKVVDLTGRAFDRLVVLGFIGSWSGHLRWACACQCGAIVRVRTNGLTSGKTRSCGCLQRDVASATMTIHGESAGIRHRQTPENKAWAAMRDRCSNPRHPKWADYGGRGIRVCERWNSYANFIEDMGRRPSPDHSIDRRNNDGNYEPGNCRWATRSEQQNNRRPRVGEARTA